MVICPWFLGRCPRLSNCAPSGLGRKSTEESLLTWLKCYHQFSNSAISQFTNSASPEVLPWAPIILCVAVTLQPSGVSTANALAKTDDRLAAKLPREFAEQTPAVQAERHVSALRLRRIAPLPLVPVTVFRTPRGGETLAKNGDCHPVRARRRRGCRRFPHRVSFTWLSCYVWLIFSEAQAVGITKAAGAAHAFTPNASKRTSERAACLISCGHLEVADLGATSSGTRTFPG